LGDARQIDALHHALPPSNRSRAMMAPTNVSLGAAVSHFNPHRTGRRPCWHCAHFDGMTACGSAALCNPPSGPRVHATPGMGCFAWQREPVAADEPDAGPPAANGGCQASRSIVLGHQGN
jgi:hypothetical protein